jgi:hypothetical protein
MIYTDEQIQWLRDNRSKQTIGVITAYFNERFGTTVSKKALAETCKRKKIKTGRDGCFVKGNEPWNKGVKGWNSEKCKATAFKPGQKSTNVKPVGHERTGKEGYTYVKIAEGIKQYRLKHRIIWEQQHGPIPQNHKIVFLDNDRTNIDIENLALVSNSVLATLNRHENFKQLSAELKKTMIAVIQLEQKARKANTNKQNTPG